MLPRRILDRLALIVVTAAAIAGCGLGDDSADSPESAGVSKTRDSRSSALPSGSPEPPSGRKPGGSIQTERIGVMHEVRPNWCYNESANLGHADSMTITGLPDVTAWTRIGTTDAEQSAVSRSMYLYNSVCAASARVARKHHSDLPLPDHVPDDRCVIWGQFGVAYGPNIQIPRRSEETLPDVDLDDPRVTIDEDHARVRRGSVYRQPGDDGWRWVWVIAPETEGLLDIKLGGRGVIDYLRWHGMGVDSADGRMTISSSASATQVVPDCTWEMPPRAPLESPRGTSRPTAPRPSASPGTIHVDSDSTDVTGYAASTGRVVRTEGTAAPPQRDDAFSR